MKNKNNKPSANKRKAKSIQYETVAKNIQKITSTTGTVTYRVRVGRHGEVLSKNESSFTRAKKTRKELLA